MRSHYTLRSGVLAVVTAAATGMALPASAQQAAQEAAHPALARLLDGEGQEVGSAALVETPRGLLIQLEVRGLPGGVHGFHIHETGVCEGPDFKSAGGHFNPDDRSHGFLSENGHHAGDLPNIYTEEGSERTRADVFATGLALEGAGELVGLLDDDGAAVVIHSTADDYQTDPAGHAGERIACGVIEREEVEQ